ncbi:MAG: hypothetical protein M3063_04975 [Actinomycetota bacterium]|nr:hypothetical protein [Actinomycetota bacterium]
MVVVIVVACVVILAGRFLLRLGRGSAALRPPARCISLTVGGRPCWRPVAERGQRCHRCWHQLTSSPTASQRIELAAEPGLPPLVAAALKDDTEPMVRIVIAGRSDVGAHLLVHLAQDPDPGVRAALAANASLPPALDARLAVDHDPVVVIGLAARPGLTPEVLAGLRRHLDPRVRGAVAGNPSADDQLDRAVACGEDDPVVLAALASKPSASGQVLAWLAQHPVPLVAETAAGQLRHRPPALR